MTQKERKVKRVCEERKTGRKKSESRIQKNRNIRK